MSPAGLHKQRLVGADLVKIRFGNVFFIFNPSRCQVELALWVLLDKLLDDLAVFGVVGQAYLREVRLPDGAVTGQIAVAMGLHESGIDEVLTIIQHLRIRACEFLSFFFTADIGKHAVLH